MGVSSRRLEERVTELSDLPTLPAVVKNISKMVLDKRVSASDIGGLIAKDQGLSARILRIVNSPFYGFPGRISSVTHAVVLLGFNVVKGLVLSTAVFDAFAQQAQGLWEHSLGCAIISRGLARELAIQEIEEVMVAGLLHDLGRAILSHVVPEEYEAACRLACARNCHIALAENEIFGVDHAGVAGWLARDWNLPARLTEPIVFHHSPTQARQCTDVAAIVQLADILTRGMGYGRQSDTTMPPLDQQAFHNLGVSFEQIDRVLDQAEVEFAEGIDLFMLKD